VQTLPAKLELKTADLFERTSLDKLAEWITKGHAAIGSGVRRMAVDVAQIGAWLVAAKSKLAHGEWLPWLAENCREVHENTARSYMRTYREAERNPQLIVDLTPTQAYKKLGIVKADGKSARKKEREEAEDAAVEEVATENPDIVCADFRAYLKTCTADAIVTDPPYPKEYLPLYGDLAKLAKRFSVVAIMCGQSYLPQIMAHMDEHLDYCWTFAYLTPGGQAVQLWDRQVLTFWKPVLVFGKLSEWAGDVVKSPVNANEKEDHKWGQSVGGMQDLIRRITTPGQTICDPFMGGGTTAVAAVTTGRRIVGCDIDAQCVATTQRRLAECGVGDG